MAWLSCLAMHVEARQAGREPAAPVRDPYRGLSPELRARLALADAREDSWAAEHWAAAVTTRLDEIAARWADDRIETALAEAKWIAPSLRVAPLFTPMGDPAPAQLSWRLQRGIRDPDEPRERATLPRALGAWRASFRGPSRFDCEVFGFEGEPPEVGALVRVSASGSSGAERLQHNAMWRCRWRIVDGSAELVDLAVESFEAAAIPGQLAAFADVTESMFEDPQLFRERLLPGLDHWGRTLPSTLFPGTLGHHGLAIADVNGDGLEDLYVCRPGGLPNQLLLHTPEHTVVDASAAAGVDLLDYSSSALLVDLDGDRDADLVVATGTGLVFFENDGAARFERRLLIERSLATTLAAADFDADGDVDLYACSYLSPYEKDGLPVPYHDANNGEANMLLRNDGAWSFADVTAVVGLDENNRRFSLAAAWEDFDNDGDQDLYVANDFGRNNLYRNDGGRFDDVAAELAAEDVSAGMGVTWGDVDHDGWMDLYVTNMRTPAASRLTSRPRFRAASSPETLQDYRDHAQGNTLFSNRGGARFEDIAESSGTSFGRWGWGSIFVDFDDDGALDLFAPDGFVSGERGPDLDSFFWRQVVLQSPEDAGGPRDGYGLGWRAVNRLVREGRSWNGHERNVAFWNAGGTSFADVSAAIGLDHPDDSRAAARIDWDGDGDEDLFVTNRTGPMLRLLENRQRTGHAWIAFDLRASDANRTAIGARVVLDASDGRRHSRTLRCGEGYLAQSTSRIHFGLGRAGVERVAVRWPGGESEAFGSPEPGSVYLLEQGTAAARAIPARPPSSRLRASSPAPPPLAASARTVLPKPLPLPRMQLETWDGKPASLLGITMQGPLGTGQPLLLILWSAADASRGELERIGAAADALRGAGLRQVLALSVDAAPPERERAVAAWKDTAWPFARGFISEESLSVLELVLAALHDEARGITVPAAFLVDPGGNLVATYQGPLDPELLRSDLRLLGADARDLRDASVPFPGRWIARDAPSLEPEVAARLVAHGLERPAAEYELARVESRGLTAASFEYEAALAYHRGGRHAEAIRRYRRALDADPAYAAAAQGLAAALHELGDHAAALAAYKDALKLDPAHAPTRLSLGLLYVALRDIEGARAELRSLRSLQSELAATLEARIREIEDR